VKKKGNADWQPRQVTTRKINVDLIGSGWFVLTRSFRTDTSLLHTSMGNQRLITSRLPMSAHVSERKAWPSSTTESKHRQAHYLGLAYWIAVRTPHLPRRLPYGSSENCPNR
jgi:hypothetical protein